MSNDATQTWLRQAATARPSARRIRLVTDMDIVTRYVPRLAGRNVHLSGDPMWYDTRAEAVEAARRARQLIAAEAKMSNETQYTPADVRERIKAAIREGVRYVAKADGAYLYEPSVDETADRILSLLRTPRGEGEAEPVAWRVEYRRRGDGDRWYHLSTYTNEMDARERAKHAEGAMRVLECRIIPLYASPAAALHPEAQGEEDVGEVCHLCGEEVDPRVEIEVEPLAAADMERVPTTQGER